MSSNENRIQSVVHALEQGGVARWIQVTAFVLALIALCLFYLFVDFKGLSEPRAMEQAQIARELSRGNGFTTKAIRPLALWQLANRGRTASEGKFPDTYHAPLPPLLHALPLKVLGDAKYNTKVDPVYPADRVIALTCILFFVGGMVFSFLLGRELFDTQIALLGSGLILICNLLWQFCLSGLPQSIMLFFLSATLYFLVKGMKNAEEGKGAGFWLSAVGVSFGMLALCHALTLWMFAGALIFIGVYFRPRLISLTLVVGFFLVTFSPWLLHNYAVSGSPVGLGFFSALSDIGLSDDGWMRTYKPDFSAVNFLTVFNKVPKGVLGQIGSMIDQLGWVLVAPLFFVSLLHPFKNKTTSSLRWGILLMWIGSLIGISFFGSSSEALHPNNLQVLLAPVLTFYGFAFLVVLWNRQPLDHIFFRYAFYTLIYLVSAIPLIIVLWPKYQSKVHWPPYAPPLIYNLNEWIAPQEVVVTDMPWAVGWYADRRAFWLPMQIPDFIRVNDYNELGGPLVGLYLTPISGDKRFLRDIGKGEYKEWAQFILRNPNLKDFPLKAGTALPPDNECIFFSDHDRWSSGAVNR